MKSWKQAGCTQWWHQNKCSCLGRPIHGCQESFWERAGGGMLLWVFLVSSLHQGADQVSKINTKLAQNVCRVQSNQMYIMSKQSIIWPVKADYGLTNAYLVWNHTCALHCALWTVPLLRYAIAWISSCKIIGSIKWSATFTLTGSWF